MVQVILPLKAPGIAKSRLKDALEDDQRTALVEAMALDVVDAVLASESRVRLTVLAPLCWQRLLPRSPFLKLLSEERLPGGDLNELLRHAMELEKPDQALVLHGDLPFLTARDIAQARQKLQTHNLVLCPDAAGEGTNALGFCAPAVPVFHFGPDSFAAHRHSADAGGCCWTTLERPGFGRDVDTPADLFELLRSVASDTRVGARTALWAKRYGPKVLALLKAHAQGPTRSLQRPRIQAPGEVRSSLRSSTDPEPQGIPL